MGDGLYMRTDNKAKPKILSQNLFPVVGIGASSGGLEAFKKLIKAIPHDSGMAYILVQHLHPEHESVLPEILQRITKIPVVEISDNVHVDPDHIYVIPSNKMLVATDGILKLSPRPAKDKLNMPIDIFFSSLAEVHQAHAIGVVLSGNGADGTAGLKDIKEHSGFTFAENPDSASYNSMPQHAIDAEVVDFVLAPEKIPERLMELKRSFKISSSEVNKPGVKDKENEDGFRQILSLLRVRVGMDFSFYKQTTVRRRIIRRMLILHLETITEYLDYLKKNKQEPDILFQDLLIPVTSFFRDPLTFDILCETVLPEIVKDKTTQNPLRIWIAGCSTGQEAYSVAICIHEYLSDHISNIKVQIFATDISEQSIKKARAGIYLKKELVGISPIRLDQFFNKIDGNYQVKKTVRDMCVFAVHNFLKDPPFAKMDLINCRNVLIYLEPFLQKKALTTFHYALNDRGILLLGKSETTGNSSDLFLPFGKRDKLFTRKAVPGRFINVVSERNETDITDKNYHLRNKEGKTDDFQKNADDILLSKYTPVGVVVNDQFEIVQFRGLTGEYLEPSPGKASLNVLKMAKEGLAFEIRNALHKAKATSEPFIKEGILINNAHLNKAAGSGKKLVTIEVIPLLNTIDLHFLILFRDEAAGGKTQSSINKKKLAAEKKDEKDIRIKQLEKELSQAREDMRDITEEQEAANEELQSSNEELLSGSEELQSLNEELETSKEELQSTNEELITVNQELYERNEELNQSRKFANTTISILHEPLLVLDNNFRIKSANKSFYKNFQLTENETLGKILFELKDNGWEIPGLHKKLENILDERDILIEVEITFTFPDIGERSICFNIQPLNRESGEQLILLALDDITLRKKAAQIQATAFEQLERNAEMIHNLYMNAPAFLCTFRGPKHIYDLVNPSYQKLFGKRKIVGKPVMEALPELVGQDFDTILDKVYNTGKIFIGNEVLIRLARDEGLLPEDRFFNFSYQPTYNEDKKINGILVFGYEVTEQVLAKKLIEKHLRLVLESIPQITITASVAGDITFFNQYFLDYIGLTLEEANAGRRWENVIHPNDLAGITLAKQHSLATGEDLYNEVRLKRKSDGTYHWHLARAMAIKNDAGKIVSWVGTATDIDNQKVNEQKKDEFISVASHEMKTPLTTAKAYLQLLELELSSNKNNGNANLYAKKATLSIIRLNELITELLDVSKIQSGKLNYHITAFNFDEMIDSTIENIQYTSPLHTIIKTGIVNQEVTGDKDRLEQVVINLLSNAIKYSPDAGKVFINVAQENGEIKVSVKDEGIGISKKNLEKIFERYYRVEDSALQFQGLGIGLFISYEIIQRHHGKLWAESEPGKGSTFYFTFPCKQKITNF